MSGITGVTTRSLSEDLLVRRAQRGDHEAIEHLILRHQPMLAVVTALKLKLDPYGRQAEDLDSIASVAIIEALSSYDPARGARFPTYAYYNIHSSMLRYLFPASERIPQAETPVRTTSLDAVRPEQEPGEWEYRLLDRDPDYGTDEGYAAVGNDERDASVRRFVADLAPNQRSITRSIYWDGDTHAEIAQLRGISRPAITRTLQRVHARGTKDLDQYMDAIAS